MTDDSCTPFASRLARAADDTLDANDRRLLDAHVAGCPSCRSALQTQRAVRAALQGRPTARANTGFAAAVMAGIDADRPWFDRLDFRIWTWRAVPVAAALLVGVLVVLPQTAPETIGATDPVVATTAFDPALPVSAALWQDSVPDTSVLSLMLRAQADDRLADAYQER